MLNNSVHLLIMKSLYSDHEFKWNGKNLSIQENNQVDWQEDVYKLTYTENQMIPEGLQTSSSLN